MTCAASAQSKAVDPFALEIVDDHTKEVTGMKNGKVGRFVDRAVVWERVGS